MSVKRYCMLGFVLIALVIAALAPFSAHAQAQDGFSLTLQNIGEDDVPLEGMFADNSVWIPMASNWLVTQDVEVNLVYTASPVLNSEVSTFSVQAEDSEVFSLHPVPDGVAHSVSFVIPRAVLDKSVDGFTLSFSAYLRLTKDTCEDPLISGQWLKVSNQTNIQMHVREDTSTPQLTNLSHALVMQNPYNPAPPLVFVLPDQWNMVALNTAAQIAGRLGGGSLKNSAKFSMIRSSELTAQIRQDANLVIIGKPGEWPAIPNVSTPPQTRPNGSSSPTPQNALVLTTVTPAVETPTLAPNVGYFKVLNSPWNPARNLLLVNGQTDDDIAQAGSIFASDDRFALLQGSQASLSTIMNTPLIPAQHLIWHTDTTTFAQLGLSDVQVNGLGLFGRTFDLLLPPGWLLTPGAKLALDISNSPSLAKVVSHIAVYANDIYVGAIQDNSDGSRRTISLNLPVERLQRLPRGAYGQKLQIRLSVANVLTLEKCQSLSSADVAWTRINSTSALVTPHKYRSWPDLQAFPYPFFNDKSPASTVIVLPNNPSDETLGKVLTLAARLRESSTDNLDVAVTTADQVTPSSNAHAHLIVLGKKSDQPLLETLIGLMPPITDPVVNATLQNPDAGILEETVSPLDSKRALLMVFSESEAGYQMAFAALNASVPPIDRPGSVAFVTASQPLQVIYQAVPPDATAAAPAPDATPEATDAAGS